MEALAINLLNGLSFGALLFLLASGLSLILGLMGIANLAHGALFLFGAYIGVFVAKQGGHFFLAALAGGLGVALVGLVMERGFLRHLHGRILEQVLISFGFIYILTNIATWIWGTAPQIVTSPITGSVSIGDITFPAYRTRIGAMVRAGMDNREMTVGLGINIGLIFTLVFCLGAFIAGFAGILGVPILGAYPWVALQFLISARELSADKWVEEKVTLAGLSQR
ncbi:hypothetical protein ES703_115501 [subsurface metagenome]